MCLLFGTRANPLLVGFRQFHTHLSYPTAQGTLRLNLLKTAYIYGHYSSRVNRLYNEDRYSACILDLPMQLRSPLSDEAEHVTRKVFNFNIFDGHGGDECSSYLTDHLPTTVETIDLSPEHREKLILDYSKNVGGYWKMWYRKRQERFETMIEKAKEDPLYATVRDPNAKFYMDDLQFRLPLSFLQTDYDFFSTIDKAGSTCTSLYIHNILPQPKSTAPPKYHFDKGSVSKLTIAHIGDTKALLCTSSGEAHALTQPHHPSNPLESRRLNLSLIMQDSFGESRYLNFANTRAFGDIGGKTSGIAAEPEISTLLLGDAAMLASHGLRGAAKDVGASARFLVLVCDGVTDILSDQEIVDIIMNHVNNRGIQDATPQQCAMEVIKFVEAAGGDDNATCLIVRLGGWGEWPVLDRTGSAREAKLKSAVSSRDRH
ncbi:hypothetical protein BABINDRAFT_37247 [Babjeviella inositovora NRRL Y-12698]|uniref:PPM-type phosphatase domain-containing protein n=1 Tax=Babjeviella inositovora NRRL Y-12698 TaxID=984486 RepID=A0A1E3QQZ5_9ASCO|nr:uncharacterized protein BABINDRAFT_37247 [Babjeviella inositovora NRRL Y-12698]ODQ79377.1 hypothetical protein BABINDRAFT_37247 [Babjeviella inositovora NRRL Y-12698]